MNLRQTLLSLRLQALGPASGILLALLPAAGPAAGQALATARGDLLLRGAGGESVVQRPAGARVALPLSKAGRVSDFRSVSETWFAAATDRDAAGAPRLLVFRGRGGEIESLGSPPETAAMLSQPALVAGDDGIGGLAWLAGDAHHQLAVRASRWTGDGWAAPETVSPPGKGTQIALSTALLTDGSWLLVWAAFDGNDDEILWSRFSGGAWSPPRPVAEDNAVPDITPQLFAAGDGALVAWSRYDGNDYRVHTARFAGGTFSTPRTVGPPGSTAPSFAAAAAPYLIHHLADPQGWAVIELDAAGRALRRAAIEAPEPERPVLAAVTGETVTFEWIRLERQAVSVLLAWVEK